MGKALVIGDVMLDQRIEGSMSRISPEAAVPVVDIQGITASPGGAANVAANLAAMGHDVYLYGLVGSDALGQQLRGLLFNRPRLTDRLLLDSQQGVTTVKTRITCNGQQVLRIDTGCKNLTNVTFVPYVLQALTSGEIQLVVFSDYDKGGVPLEVISAVMTHCAANGIPVLVDAKPAALLQYVGASLVKVNLSEAVEFAKETSVALALDDADPLERGVAAGRHLMQIASTAIVTCGSLGALYFLDSRSWQHHPAAEVAAVCDATGAGDVFMAALAACVLERLPAAESIRLANIAAGLSVQQHGTVVISREAWEHEQYKRGGEAAKHMDYTQVQRFAANARAHGKRIVFTNGCFDLLHPGHLHLLQQARQQGDVLIVAFNSDISVSQLKGLGRPVIGQQWRAVALAAYADAVVMYDEPTPERLIHAIRPDVLVKGAEYTGTPVPGDDFVVAHGGRVHFVDTLPGYSTSQIVGTPHA